MNYISFFGEILAEELGINKIQGAGLIRLSVKEAGIEINSLTFKQLQNIFKKELKNRLDRLGISSVGNVIIKMNIELIKNQSLFTMSRI